MTVTAFFTVQCKFVTTMDSLRKEAEKNTQRTNSRGYYYFDEKPDSAQTNSLHVDQNNNCEAINLSFATNFLAVYLFIKVKGSRPMTYQYLTV